MAIMGAAVHHPAMMRLGAVLNHRRSSCSMRSARGTNRNQVSVYNGLYCVRVRYICGRVGGMWVGTWNEFAKALARAVEFAMTVKRLDDYYNWYICWL